MHMPCFLSSGILRRKYTVPSEAGQEAYLEATLEKGQCSVPELIDVFLSGEVQKETACISEFYMTRTQLRNI